MFLWRDFAGEVQHWCAEAVLEQLEGVTEDLRRLFLQPDFGMLPLRLHSRISSRHTKGKRNWLKTA
jgi:hypothetical protein